MAKCPCDAHIFQSSQVAGISVTVFSVSGTHVTFGPLCGIRPVYSFICEFPKCFFRVGSKHG